MKIDINKSFDSTSFPSFLPKKESTKSLFLTGATIGPIVDSFHNQCLLEYDRAPINIPNLATTLPIIDSASASQHYLFSSSLYIPPLLGIAYVVLGGVLPRVFRRILLKSDDSNNGDGKQQTYQQDVPQDSEQNNTNLKQKAILAVCSTIIIIRLSEYLTVSSVNDSPDNSTNLLIMAIAALTQWVVLDRSFVSLIVASIVAIGGPLSELPFVYFGFWHYLPSVQDYFPLENFSDPSSSFSSLANLGLSGITGPCYFAVTMDAIALGRYFDHQQQSGTDG